MASVAAAAAAATAIASSDHQLLSFCGRAAVHRADRCHRRLEDAGVDGVAVTCLGDCTVEPNTDVRHLESDAESPSPMSTLRETRLSVTNNDDNVENESTDSRPDSVWLEYLYAWNPLAAGSNYTSVRTIRGQNISPAG